MTKINVGCGSSPTEGWENYDNSYSMYFAKLPYFLISIFKNIGLINPNQKKYIDFIRENKIGFLDAGKRLPFNSEALTAIYTSHMVEHLSKETAIFFFKECHRCLCPGGILRVSVPSFQLLIDDYNIDGDVEKFLRDSHLLVSNDFGLTHKIKSLFLGYRHHQYMYTESLLTNILENCGFVKIISVDPGETNIDEPGSLNLFERKGNSIFIEAIK